jgi:hypothetical protein
MLLAVIIVKRKIKELVNLWLLSELNTGYLIYYIQRIRVSGWSLSVSHEFYFPGTLFAYFRLIFTYYKGGYNKL